MDRRYGLAEGLVDAIAKEATGQVAKSVVGVVKFAVVAAAVTICALAHALWSSNPPATVALLALSFLLGLTIGIAFGWRRACKTKNDRLVAKDAEIAELKKRPTQEDVGNLKKDHEKEIAELKSRISDLEDSSRKALEQVRTPSGKLCANLAAVRMLPVETIQAMLDAFDRGGSTDLGRHEECVRRSIANKDGIFRLGTMWFNGVPGDPDGTYLLTNEWKSFMDDTKVLAAMRGLARPSGPVWQTL